MGNRRLTFLSLGFVLAVAACRDDDARTASTTATASQKPPRGTSPRETISWFEGAEPLLLVPAHSSDRATVALADSTAVEDREGALTDSGTFLRLDGTSISARVALTRGSESCIEASLDPAPAGAWGVGFVGGAPRGLPADSLRGLSRSDSTALTRMVFRLASTVPNDSAGRFSGLPFGLMDLWRLQIPGGGSAIVASTRRQINQEDSPLQERTFIIAESDSAASDGYSLVYSSRSSGSEETVEARELLAAFTFGSAPSIHLAIASDFGGDASWAIVERIGRGRWVTRWVSRRVSC
jgi:hypothetical protein